MINHDTTCHTHKKVQLDYKSNIFPHHEPQGSISRPFLLPKENNKLFEYLNRVNKENTNQPNLVASINCKGLKLKEGIIRVNGITEDKEYDCDFLFDTGSFWYRSKNVYLSDIDYTRKIADGANYSQAWIDAMNYTKDHFYPDVEYAFFPVYAPNFPDVDIVSWPDSMIINNYVAEDESYGWPDIIDSENHTTPYFYLVFVIEKVMEAFGYKISKNILYDDEGLRKLVIYNKNNFRNGDNYDIPEPGMWVSFKYDLPKILVSDFINDLRKRGIVFYFDDNNRSVEIRLLENILSSTSVNDISAKTGKRKKQSFTNNNGIKFSFDTPDVWGGNDTIPGDEILTDFELTGTVDDFSDLPIGAAPDVLYLVKSHNRVYRKVIVPASGWEFYTEYFEPYQEGNDPDISIETDFGVLATKNVESITGLDFKLLPYDGDERIVDTNPKINKNEKLALLFYHGLISFRLDFPDLYKYPFASYNGFYIDFNDDYSSIVNFNYSLIWQFYKENFLEKYIALMLSTNLLTVERLLDFSVEDIKHMDLYEKKRINNPNDAETADYIIEEMSVAVSGNEISGTQVTMVRV